MTQATLTISFAVKTARGERRRIRSFIKEVKGLGVEMGKLPRDSVRALDEADRFLGRYLDVLSHETPTHEQLEGVMEALGGIDRVVKNAMAEILKSLGWRPEAPQGPDEAGRGGLPAQIPEPRRRRRSARAGAATTGKVIPFPGPRKDR